MSDTERRTPYGAFNFLVAFNGQDISAGFSEISGLGAEITIAEYRNGNDPENHVRKVPNINKVGDVTLKRGVIDSNDIWKWINETRRSGYTAQRDVTITLVDEVGDDVSSWKLHNTVPIKYTGPSLSAKGGTDVAIEELVLAAESITYSKISS